MKNRLFGRLGGMIKGNGLVALLFVAVIAAGVFSYNTINNINRRLENQKLEQIETTPSPRPEQEPVQDVQTPQENVPLPGTNRPDRQQKPRQGRQTAAQQETDEAEVTATPRPEKFILPVTGKIYSTYSGEELVYNRTLDDWRTHNGIDITARPGESVHAGAAGTVTSVINDGMLGTLVEVNHGDFTARYCGLAEKTFVNAGDNVTQGQAIGTVGEITMEVAEESHIHLEVIRDGSYINPDVLLK